MGLRTFRDATGTEWQVWDVHPSASGRRQGTDRRVAPAPEPIIERRRTPDRRAHRRARPPVVAAGLAGGWLCFEARTGAARIRRRLTPIPPGWEHCADTVLARHLEDAAPAPARIRRA